MLVGLLFGWVLKYSNSINSYLNFITQYLNTNQLLFEFNLSHFSSL